MGGGPGRKERGGGGCVREVRVFVAPLWGRGGSACPPLPQPPAGGWLRALAVSFWAHRPPWALPCRASGLRQLPRAASPGGGGRGARAAPSLPGSLKQASTVLYLPLLSFPIQTSPLCGDLAAHRPPGPRRARRTRPGPVGSLPTAPQSLACRAPSGWQKRNPDRLCRPLQAGGTAAPAPQAAPATLKALRTVFPHQLLNKY